MDDDDLPSAVPAPPGQPPFPAYDPGWCAAPAAAVAADPKLGFLDAKIDDCDVWDGVPEGEEEEVGKVEIGAVTGEEDDLMLDMLRSQQDGQFIIGGEDVLAGAGLVTEFTVKDDGGGAVMDVEIGGMEESSPNLVGLQKEPVDTCVCLIDEVNLPVKDDTEVAMGAGEEGGVVLISDEVEMTGAEMAVDTEAVKTLGVDNSMIDDCRAADCADDVVKQERCNEVEVGIEVQSAVSISEMVVLGGEEVGLAGSSSSERGEEVGIAQPCLLQVGEEVGGGPSLPQVPSSAQGGEEVGGEDPSSPQGSEKVGGTDLGATDTTESEKEMAHMIDDSQLLDVTMPAVEAARQEDDTPSAPVDGTEVAVADVSQMDADNSGNVPTKGPGRKKRGRQPKAQTPKPFKKKGEEDVCFICFDGGDLVVCDRRGCPKVYHPSCVNRDEAFFRAKGRWNCGWHICSICEKAAQYMCYTCTYSLCKGCIKESEFVCIRGNKGLCVTCRGMVMLIETNDPAAVNFYDKSSWEHLFKDYWIDVKEKLSITFDEITKGKRPSKKAAVRNEESSDEVYEANEGAASSSDSSSGRGSSAKSKKKAKRRKAVTSNEESSVTVVDSAGSSVPGDGDWASKELLEFVSHMKDGDSSVLSQFDVQALLLEYIKRNKLRDPRRKSQIICDSRLENLFGKARVGHFEMLKLLESHFLIKEASHFAAEDDQMAIGDPDASRMDAEGCSDAMKMIPEKRRKGRRKDDREPQTNFDDYAAIDVHNINLIYLRRNLMEDLIDDTENFNGKVVGSFVRIRITASGQRQDMYRLVKVIGTTKAPEKYQSGKKTTDILLEILNLNKTEVMSIDTISNQEFTEEECKRLRQSIKIGFIPRMTVGELQEKARDLQTIKVNDWLETEKARLSHLRDRASETGRRKELRECVEKLEMLPEEHLRKLSEIPEVHSDPNMDPNYVSAEEEPDDRKQDSMHNRHRGSTYYRKGKDAGLSEKSIMPVDWSGPRKGLINSSETRNEGDGVGVTDAMHGSSWGRSKDVPQQNSSEMQSHRGSMTPQNASQSLQAAGQAHLSANISVSTPSLPTRTTATTGSSINESEKVWHYQDPTGKIQGPFSMVQLRKWNSTGYFPRDLRIWKASEKQEDSILLSDALIGKFDKVLPVWGSQQQSGFQSSNPTKVMDSRDISKNWLGQSDHDQSAVMKTTNASNSAVPAIAGMAKIQDHIGTWNSGRSTAYPSNGPSYDRHTHTTGSSFQHLPVQQANFQPVAFGPNLGLGANMPPAKINSPTTNSNMPGSSRGSQSRVRVSRWEPEVASTSMHGAQPGNQLPRKGEPTLASGHVAALLPPMDSPTPRSEQLSGFSVANDHQKSSSSIADPLPLQGISSLDSNAAIAKNAGLPGHDKSSLEIISQKRELQNVDSLARDPNSEKNFSPIRTEGGVSIVNPDIASVDVKNSNWSTPSPTPCSEMAQMDAGAQVVSVNNVPAFSDSNRLPSSVQINSDSSIGPAPQTIMPQTPGLLVNQNSGWPYAPDNSGVSVISTQASAGWGTQLPANANMTWVAPGTSNVAWTPLPQGNANVVGWGPAAAGTQIVNTVPQVAGTGSMPPVAGWGPVAQVVPPANASWGTAIQQPNVNPGWGTAVQGFPNANPGWGVPQPANMDQNVGWGGPIAGNPNANVAWGMTNGSPNAGWNSPSGNPNNWGSHQREQDRHNRNPNNGDTGHGGGRHRMHSSGGQSWDPNGPRGICRFHENGHCKKGASCNFLHT